VLAYQVIEDSAADRAGIKPLDVIMEFAGERVRDPGALQEVVERLPVGSTQEVKVYRDGKVESLTVELATVEDPTAGSQESGSQESGSQESGSQESGSQDADEPNDGSNSKPEPADDASGREPAE
jgi:serine protease Do